MLEVTRREAVYLWYYFDIQFRQIFWYWVLGMVLEIGRASCRERVHHDV